MLIFVLFALPDPGRATTIEGHAQAIDGDTLTVGDRKVRLFGIDAPELDQTCRRSGRSWACGTSAKQMLADLVASGPVRCDVMDLDRYGREVAVCKVRGDDIGALMVRQGGAIAYRKYSSRYVPAETAARREGLGLWAATWITPEEFRHSGDTQPVPDADCPIKGNIGNGGRRIYHLPGQADYSATRIDTRRGERWFCSEAEARAAGFRRAAR